MSGSNSDVSIPASFIKLVREELKQSKIPLTEKNFLGICRKMDIDLFLAGEIAQFLKLRNDYTTKTSVLYDFADILQKVWGEKTKKKEEFRASHLLRTIARIKDGSDKSIASEIYRNMPKIFDGLGKSDVFLFYDCFNGFACIDNNDMAFILIYNLASSENKERIVSAFDDALVSLDTNEKHAISLSCLSSIPNLSRLLREKPKDYRNNSIDDYKNLLLCKFLNTPSDKLDEWIRANRAFSWRKSILEYLHHVINLKLLSISPERKTEFMLFVKDTFNPDVLKDCNDEIKQTIYEILELR